MQIFNFENVLNSLESLRANKTRAFLSMLGIIIGVSSVIILMAMGNGTTKFIVDMIDDMGTNTLTIAPETNTSANDRVFRKDILNGNLVEKIKSKMKGLEGVLPLINSAGKLVYGADDINVSIAGIDQNFFPIRDIKVEFGKNFTEKNIKNKERVAIIGQDIVKDLFNKQNPIGQKVKMGNNVFDVIGVLENSLIYNSAIFFPISTVSTRITGQSHYSQIIVVISDSSLIYEKQDELDKLLKKELKIANQNTLPYKISNQAKMLDYIEDAMATMTILLAGIASISLLVGGIGIMNIMLVSVTERIKEIGIRKAIGAGGIDILMQFLTESSILSVIGGLIGIAFAYVVCNFVDYFWGETLPVAISSTSIILSFSVSLTIGLVFGITPARRAAQLRPIEALRFE